MKTSRIVFALLTAAVLTVSAAGCAGTKSISYQDGTYSGRSSDHKDDEDGNIWDFIIPMGILVAVAVVTGDILTAVILALMVCFLLYVPRKILSVDEFLNSMIRGFGDMLSPAFLLPGLCCKIEKT